MKPVPMLSPRHFYLSSPRNVLLGFLYGLPSTCTRSTLIDFVPVVLFKQSFICFLSSQDLVLIASERLELASSCHWATESPTEEGGWREWCHYVTSSSRGSGNSHGERWTQ